MAPEHPRSAALAVGADAVCLLAFVAIGRTSHDLHGGVGWFVAVLWPFAVGWSVAALATRLYTTRSHPWARIAGTCVLGVTAALVLRATLTTRSTPVVFGIVAFSFLTLTTFGWRAVSRLVRRARVSA
jgi:cobalamin biosynthesis protein CobD/CbiB